MEVTTYNGTNALYKWIFESANFGIIVLDAHLRIVDVNNWIIKKAGDKGKNLKGSLILESFPEITDRELDEYLRSAISGKSAFLSSSFHDFLIDLPVNYENLTGQMKQNITISPVMNGMSVEGVIIHIEDVSERLFKEKLLQEANESLKELNSMKDKFFRIIAHDLRGPYTALIGFSQMLLDHASLLPGEIGNLIKTLHTSLKNQYMFVDNLLKWVQMQSGTFELRYTDVSFLEIMDHIIRIAGPAIRSKEIEVKMNIPENLTLASDKQALTTILYNIFFNAVKFTPKQGSVIIDITQDELETIISVTDTGIGIPQDRIGKLFRIDEVVSTPGTNREKGSGLGLILVKELIEKLHGKILVRSHEGEGSTFTIILPLIKL